MPPENPFIIPTINPTQLKTQIEDLKKVEHWLNLNLELLRTSIKTLEAQLAAQESIGQFFEAASPQADAPEQTAKPATDDQTDAINQISQEMMVGMQKMFMANLGLFTTDNTLNAKKSPKKQET